ncbi:MAG: hypothetical protein ACK4UO_13025 [Pseudolabrys sp.]
MSDHFAKLAELRKRFPEDIDRIDQDGIRVQELLDRQEFSLLPVTKEFIALCRKDILFARVKLASDRSLTEAQRNELWSIVDARLWFLNMVVKDYDSELAQIDQEIEAELHR